MENLMIYFGGVVITLILLVILAASHGKMLLKHANEEWETLKDLLGLRQDKLPNLIETVRRLTRGQDGLIQEMIDAREKAAHAKICGLERVELEMKLSGVINEILGLVEEFPELKRDTNFLELRNGLGNLGKEIEEQEDVYNTKVRRYKKYKKLTGPILALLRFPQVHIFEFE